MKKILFITFLTSFTAIAKAQIWADIGVKAGFNSTWLLNQNVIDDRYTTMALKGGATGGIKIGLNFNQQYGITFDVLYAQLNHSVSSQGLNNSSWKHDYTLNYISLPLLFRNSRGGTYIEVGPQISLLNSASESYVMTPNTGANFTLSDAKSNFEHASYAAVFGFGTYMMNFTENLYLSFGFRASYGLNDIITAAGGKDKPYVPIEPTPTGKSLSYTVTRPLFIGINIELDFDFGYLASAHCGRKQFLFFN